ncbi:uncharacterized protein LOC115713283 [Cannabis sativa]|uniref:uncharacterized protein LOC115713283 n=1 Tax=Cannabis sativa TaxID=3483 RepID=UPI0029CAA0EF|nr:uncharacterized protein LOC115713283 [Cannabis sativa]
MKAASRRHQNFTESPYLRSGKADSSFSPGVNATGPAHTSANPNRANFMGLSSPDFRNKNKEVIVYSNQEEDADELAQTELKRKRFASVLNNEAQSTTMGHVNIMGHATTTGHTNTMGQIHIDPKNLHSIKYKLGFEGAYCVEVVRAPNCIPWRLTGIYGEPNRSFRFKTWKLIDSLAASSQLLWCIIGDLNNIGDQSEKRGGRLYPHSLIHGFQSVLGRCNLVDLKLHGHPYTWERGKGTANWVEIRLDKALVSQLWLDSFPQAVLTNCDISSSDHTPIFLQPEPTAVTSFVYHFKFENAWTREPLCSQIVQSCCEDFPHASFSEKIKQCSLLLADWGRSLTCNFKQKIKRSKANLSALKGKTDPTSVHDFCQEQNNYFEILAQQELYWNQRSKQFWLNSGDKNSKFFHAMASSRKRANNIHQLQRADGSWATWDNGLQDIIVQYFQDIFTARNPNFDYVTAGIRCFITDLHNDMLLQPISDDEVRLALLQMHPDKAPGPDGMGPGFFQKHWHIVGSDVISLVRDFFETSSFPESLNDTSLVLIPKRKTPVTMGDLRPIALCNVAYKITAKVLANRMKPLLDQVISPTQSAFIPGRLIFDNIMIAFEVMHYLKHKVQGKKGYMALKLDMSKAYDRVEWGYLRAVMLQMGFSLRWVNLIMSCVTSARYSIIHGGHVMGPILPTRGIRQGDPLSTYLLIICAEGFSALISKFESDTLLQGCRVANDAPTISHMLFADDSYLFCQANSGAARSVMTLLRRFETAFGQQVNLTKSSIFFSPNVQHVVQHQICSLLGMDEAFDNSFYLGLPNIIGRNKKSILGFLKNKVINRINSWTGKLLSGAGKEILLKTVVQSLPTYAMSVFLLPLGTCDEIEKLMARFWWKTTGSKGNGINWMNWNRLSQPKHEGGLGFRLLHDFNLAMLAKQGWRFLTHPNSLVSRIYKACYFPHDDYLSADLGRNPSFVWRSIWQAQSLVRLGARRTIGNGLTVSILHQPWLPHSTNPYVTSSHVGLIGHTVSSLFSVDAGTWDIELVQDMFNHRDADLNLSIPLSFSASGDFWSWSGEHSGLFSVKSAYRMLLDNKDPRSVCHSAPETISHALLSCHFTSCCWNSMGLPAGIALDDSFPTWLDNIFHKLDDDRVCQMVMVCWSLWKARNSIVWKNKALTVANVLASARISLDHWIKAQDNTSLSSINFHNNGDGAELWTKPDTNTIKINGDAATFAIENRYGYGMVARNDSGIIIDGKAGCNTGTFTPEVAEIIGIKEALSWIKTHN